MGLGIDPMVDYAVKKLFGSKENKPLLIALLRAILLKPIAEVLRSTSSTGFCSRHFPGIIQPIGSWPPCRRLCKTRGRANDKGLSP